jgi:EAL domain-containing protein (putative c-di-GMP-specific phosphodiesterase class I)
MTPGEFLALTECLSEALVLLGGTGEVIAANTAAAGLLGKLPGRLEGRDRGGYRASPHPGTSQNSCTAQLQPGSGAVVWETIPLDLSGGGQVVLKAREAACVPGTEFIRQALAADRLSLAFQPIRRVVNGALLGYEVLVRLRGHDTIVRAEEFVPQAELGGLMPDIDAWVVEQSLALLDRAHGAGKILRLAVNLSGLSLSDQGLRAHVLERCRRLREPSTLTFEITETAAIDRFDDAICFINELRDLGCGFALDDFGSGLSSFAYLKRLPADVLKIDSLFIRSLASDAADRAMVQSMATMARTLGKTTIAEGVEDGGALLALGALGVEGAQGVYMGEARELGDWEPLHV